MRYAIKAQQRKAPSHPTPPSQMQLMSDVRYRDSSYSAAPASPALQQPWAAYPQQAAVAAPPQVAPPLMPQNVFLPATAQVVMSGAIPPVSAPAPVPAPATPQPQPQPTQVAAVMPHGHTPGQPLMVQVPDGRQFTVIAPALAPGLFPPTRPTQATHMHPHHTHTQANSSSFRSRLPRRSPLCTPSSRAALPRLSPPPRTTPIPTTPNRRRRRRRRTCRRSAAAAPATSRRRCRRCRRWHPRPARRGRWSESAASATR